MLPFGTSLVLFPLVPGEQYEVYAVLVTIIASLIVLFLFGQYWQK